jgi:hypothetical protein
MLRICKSQVRRYGIIDDFPFADYTAWGVFV